MNYTKPLSLVLVCALCISAAMAVEQPAPKTTGTPRALTEAERAKAEKYLLSLHEHTAHRFGEQMGFGPVRMLSFEPPVMFHWLQEGRKPTAAKPHFFQHPNKPMTELLGRIDQPASVVYENPLPTANGSDKLLTESMNYEGGKPKKVTPPPTGALKNAPTRPLLPAEESALLLLKNGKYLVWDQVGDEVRMVGALTAKKDCAECHATKENTLLGALTYRIPTDELLKQLRLIDEYETKNAQRKLKSQE
jgi:hypothetical protein